MIASAGRRRRLAAHRRRHRPRPSARMRGAGEGGYFADPASRTCRTSTGWASHSLRSRRMARPGSRNRRARRARLARTLTEQILYECGDPAAYATPDCVADFTSLAFTEIGPTGSRSRRPLSRRTGYAESLRLPSRRPFRRGACRLRRRNCPARAELAAGVVRSRIARRGLDLEDLRIDLVGLDSLHGRGAPPADEPYEVRLRVAARSQTAGTPNMPHRRRSRC